MGNKNITKALAGELQERLTGEDGGRMQLGGAGGAHCGAPRQPSWRRGSRALNEGVRRKALEVAGEAARAEA